MVSLFSRARSRRPLHMMQHDGTSVYQFLAGPPRPPGSTQPGRLAWVAKCPVIALPLPGSRLLPPKSSYRPIPLCV